MNEFEFIFKSNVGIDIEMELETSSLSGNKRKSNDLDSNLTAFKSTFKKHKTSFAPVDQRNIITSFKASHLLKDAVLTTNSVIAIQFSKGELVAFVYAVLKPNAQVSNSNTLTWLDGSYHTDLKFSFNIKLKSAWRLHWVENKCSVLKLDLASFEHKLEENAVAIVDSRSVVVSNGNSQQPLNSLVCQYVTAMALGANLTLRFLYMKPKRILTALASTFKTKNEFEFFCRCSLGWAQYFRLENFLSQNKRKIDLPKYKKWKKSYNIYRDFMEHVYKVWYTGKRAAYRSRSC